MKILAKMLLALLLLLGLAAAGAWFYYQSALKQPIRLDKPLIFEVKRGNGVQQLAQSLAAQGILPEPYTLPVHAIIQKKHTKIQAGFYELQPNMTIHDVLEQWVSGKVIKHRFTLIEGKTVAELLKNLQEHPQLAESALNAEDLAKELGLEVAQLEGWFAPDTYEFSHGQSALQLLKRMHQAQRDTLKALWEKRAPDLPLTSPYEALILASIIEKETGVASERAQIAGVFVRRLQQGMLLQTDPTVIYGAMQNGTYQGKLTKALLREDTPYNTYTRKGLPPTPIANPSRESIEAALHPAEGTALFFMAKREGGHTFSDTYEQHQQAVKAYYQTQTNE